MTKVCTKPGCGSTGPFGNLKSAPDGLSYWCRACHNAKSKECRLKRLDHYRAVNNATTKRRYRLLRSMPLQNDAILDGCALPTNDYANSHARWTEADNEYLEATWGVLPDAEIMQTLGRTFFAVERQAVKLGLNKLSTYRTPPMLAKILTVHHLTVIQWISLGKLKAVRTPVRNVYHIPDEALTEFLQKNPYYAQVAHRQYQQQKIGEAA